MPPDRAETQRQLARQQFRRAGDVYAQLAELEFTTRHYPEQLWNSASAYLARARLPQRRPAAADVPAERSQQRHPQGLVDLGEALLALGQWDKALLEFQQCIDQHPRDASAYRARLLASKAAAAKGDFQQAEALLQENLSGEQLTPGQQGVARIAVRAGRVAARRRAATPEAVRRLEEAVTRYPDAPQAHRRPGTWWPTPRSAAPWRWPRRWPRRFPARSGPSSRPTGGGSWKRPWTEYRTLSETLGRRDPRDMTAAGAIDPPQQPLRLGRGLCDLEQYDAGPGGLRGGRQSLPDQSGSARRLRADRQRFTGGSTGRPRPAPRSNRPRWPCGGSRATPVSKKRPTTTASNGARCSTGCAAFMTDHAPSACEDRRAERTSIVVAPTHIVARLPGTQLRDTRDRAGSIATDRAGQHHGPVGPAVGQAAAAWSSCSGSSGRWTRSAAQDPEQRALADAGRRAACAAEVRQCDALLAEIVEPGEAVRNDR